MKQKETGKKDYLGKMPSVGGFVKENQANWWIIGIFLLIVYGIKVFNVSFSHDTEAIMAVPERLYESWYTMGRFGLIFLKKVLGTYVFTPYAAALMMTVSMLLNSMLWLYLFTWVNGDRWKRCTMWIFPSFFFTSMIMAEQSGFLLQAYEVNIALLLVGAALLCLLRIFLGNGRKLLFVPAVFCCVIAFSVYQSLVPLFTAGAAICFILAYDRLVREQKECVTFSFCIAFIGKLIGIFLFSFVVYQITNKIVLGMLGMETTPYITDQIMWGTLSAKECVFNILRHVHRAMLGKRIFYNGINSVVYVGTLLYIIARIRKKESCYILYLLAVLYCLASPFLMSVLMGNEPSVRTQMLLPFIVGFFLQYLVGKLWENRKETARYAGTAAVLIAGTVVMYQSMLSARLYYTQYVQYEEDVQIASDISARIGALGKGEIPDCPVVFIGSRAPRQNLSCIKSEELELIGRSFFEVSFGTSHGTWVMQHFLATQGHSYMQPTAEQMKQAEKAAVSMPLWPETGSVAEKDGVIIVNLGAAGN